MKTLVMRRGIFLSLGIVGLLLFIFIFAVNDPNDSSDILSDSSRRLPKSQNPNQTGDHETVQMDRPDVQAEDVQVGETIDHLESQLEAFDGNVEQFSNLNRDDTQGWCYFFPIFWSTKLCFICSRTTFLIHFEFCSRQLFIFGFESNAPIKFA